MFHYENSDNATQILLRAREFSMYLIRLCLIFQNKSFLDQYDVHGWDSKARQLKLTFDDCAEISSSNVFNCSHHLIGNNYSINFLSALKSLCATIEPNPNLYWYIPTAIIVICIGILILIVIKIWCTKIQHYALSRGNDS